MANKDIFDFMEINEDTFCFKADVQKRIEFIIEKRGYFYLHEIENVYAISESLGYSNLLGQSSFEANCECPDCPINDFQFIKNKMLLRGATIYEIKIFNNIYKKYFPKGWMR